MRLDMSGKTALDLLTEAISARQTSLTALRTRLIALTDPIPVGTVLRDSAGEVCRVAPICTGASQWANRRWEVTLTGRGLVANGKLVAGALEDHLWDGNNMHHHSDEPIRIGADGDGDVLRYMRGSDTRALAERLPAAIAAYIGACHAEAAANFQAAAATPSA